MRLISGDGDLGRVRDKVRLFEVFLNVLDGGETR